jgi:hypothetical protein
MVKKLWVTIFLLGLVCSLNGSNDLSSSGEADSGISTELESEEPEWIKIPKENVPENMNLFESLKESNSRVNLNGKFKRQIYNPTTVRPSPNGDSTLVPQPKSLPSNCYYYWDRIYKRWRVRCTYYG